jgi:hypothetical protein
MAVGIRIKLAGLGQDRFDAVNAARSARRQGCPVHEVCRP